jgi:secreted Zn-dependent insulinase-like peptidase
MTGSGQTVYFFQTANNILEETLEIWSRFFIDPLFRPDSFEREINAVKSEYLNSKANIGYRLFNLLTLLCD